ncbi:MFS transporter [Chloroflexota bacterium]
MNNGEISLLTGHKKQKFFYGYVIIGASFIVQFLIVGISCSFGVFFKPLSLELGWTRATTSLAIGLAHIVLGVSAIGGGKLTDRYGPKRVFMICGIIYGLGYLLMSQVNSVWQLYLFYGVIVGMGQSVVDTPVLATLARWFDKKRGMAIGVSKVGAGIGIMIIPLLATWLIVSFGWRDTYIIIGVIAAVGILSAGILFKRDPGQVGALPDGATVEENAHSDIPIRQFSLLEAIGTRQFWLFSVIWFGCMFSVQVVMVHMVPHITDLGISATFAATVISVVGGSSILSRLVIGNLNDRIGTKSTFTIALAFLAASMIWVLFAREAWMFYLFAVFYGIAHGAFFTLLSPMLAGLFGLGSIGVIIGVVMFVGTISATISPFLAGLIFDIMGSYQLAFIIALIFSIIALLLVTLLKPTGQLASPEVS